MSLDLYLHGAPPRQRSASLFAQLRDAVIDGRLAPGDRLPTSRDLAAELGVARSTITTVYSRLIAEGYADGRTGDGTFVADHPGRIRELTATSTPARAGIRLRRTPPDLQPPPPPPPAGGWSVDLRAGRPDPGLFPVRDWRRCVITATQNPPPGYGHPAGAPELRQAIAAWIRRSRGVDVTTDEVLVTAGAQGAFDLIARAFTDVTDIVAVEDPGYPPARHAFQRLGTRVVAVPVDHEGLRVDAVPADARAIYVTPSHQSPTGAILSAARRRELLGLAERTDAFVVEDDYDTEYRYVDRPIEPLHNIDTAGRVIYVGSFSKTLSPSIRIGFVVAPPSAIDALTAHRVHVDTQPPHLTQAALASFITTGGFAQHLRRSHRVYRSRRDHLIARLDALDHDGLIAGYAPCAAGLHTDVRLQPDRDADAVADTLRARRIAIDTTRDAFMRPASPTLTIGYGLAEIRQLDRAIDALVDTLT